jgi:hypothetical protein
VSNNIYIYYIWYKLRLPSLSTSALKTSLVRLRIHDYKHAVLGDSQFFLPSLGGSRDFPVAHVVVVLILPAAVCATQSLLCSPLRLFPNPPPWPRPPPPPYPPPPTAALVVAASEAEPLVEMLLEPQELLVADESGWCR